MTKTAKKTNSRSTKKRQSIRDLYKRFIAVHHEIEKKPRGVDFDGRWKRLLNREVAIADEIARTPAADIDEMLLKIRMAIWDAGIPFDHIEDLDSWRANDGAFATLASLRGDLRRMQRKSKAA